MGFSAVASCAKELSKGKPIYNTSAISVIKRNFFNIPYDLILKRKRMQE
jgi:hypothetical protein